MPERRGWKHDVKKSTEERLIVSMRGSTKPKNEDQFEEIYLALLDRALSPVIFLLLSSL
jgi:hypothetical protein